MCLLRVTWSCVLLHTEAVARIERLVFSHTLEWEERGRLCTKELVMFEVAMQLPDDTKGVHG